MDTVMQIIISVQSEQARQALAQMKSGFTGVADAAESGSERASSAYKELTASVVEARKALQDTLTEQGGLTADAAAATEEFVSISKEQAIVDLQVAAAKREAIAAAKEELGLITPYAAAVGEAKAAQEELTSAIVQYGAASQEALDASVKFYEAQVPIATAAASVKTLKDEAKEAAAMMLGLADSTEKAAATLGPYASLNEEVAAAKRALADAILQEGASSEAAAAAREALINAETRDILVSHELAAAHKEAAASIAASSESSLLLGQNLETAFDSLEKTGKQAQWAGRQIQYTLGLPLIIAGGAGAYFALQNEKAAEALQRAYQPLATTVSGVTHETTLLSRAWVDLSNIYGVQQAQVIGIATSWAKLGANGTNLVGVVKETLNWMTLSGQSNDEATKTVIALRQQYGLTATGLHLALADINEAQLHSAVSGKDFSDAVIRGGAAAVAAGVPLRTYLALVAAISPQAGSAQLAANGLKTIFSRLLAPTQQSANALKEVGINIDDTGWKSANGAQRLQLLTTAWEKLTPAQQAAAASIIASRFQITRFDALMKDLTNSQGEYNTVLRATADDQKVLQDYTNNITHYLSSTPQAFHIALTQIENAAAQIILPLLPHILALVQQVVSLVRWFSNLNPGIQQLIISGLAFVVVFGEVKRLFGATEVLVAGLGKTLLTVAKQFGLFGLGAEGAASKTVTSFEMVDGQMVATSETAAAAGTASIAPWLALVAVAGLVAYAFRDQLEEAFRWLQGIVTNDVPDWWNTMVEEITNAISQLPTVFSQAFQDVVTIVADAAQDVYKLFSYLNPFAHHSPSLVEQTQKGSKVVGGHYGDMADSAQSFKDAHVDATKSVQRQGNPNVVYNPSASQAVGATRLAAPALPKFDFTSANSYKAALAGVNTELARQQNILKELQATQSKYSAELSQAKQYLSDWANAPIAGMKALADQIFSNDEAQKRYQLDILKLQDAYGSVDDMTSRMSKLNGELELLQGRKMDLHNAGAGSDVTGTIDSQINAVQKAQGGLLDHVNQIDALQGKLDKLARTGQELQLEQALNFDPLTRQIQDLANAQKEYPFDTIIAHVKDEKARVAELTAEYNAQTKAVNAQKGVVATLENAKRAITAAAPASAKKAKSSSAGSFDALAHAGGASFPGITSQPSFGKQGNLDDLIKQMDAAAGKFAHLDLFGPLLKQIDKFLGNAHQRLGAGIGGLVGMVIGAFVGGPLGAAIGGGIGLIVGRIIGGFDFAKIGDWIKSHWQQILIGAILGPVAILLGLFHAQIVNGIMDVLGPIGHVLAPVGHFFTSAFGAASRAVSTAFKAIGGWFSQFGHWLQPLTHELGQWGGTFQRIFGIAATITRFTVGLIISQMTLLWRNISTILRLIETIFRAVWGVIGPSVMGQVHNMVSGVGTLMHAMWAVIKVILGVIRATFAGDLKIIWAVVKGAFTLMRDTVTNILKALRGTINLILDLITGKWHKAWDDVKDIASAVWGEIKSVVLTPVHTIHDVIESVLSTIDRVWRRIWGGLRDFMSTLWSHISDGVKGPLNFVIGAVGHAINIVLGILADAADAYNSIPFVPHIHIPRHIDIPKLAKGGIVGMAGDVVVGDAGPEVLRLGRGATVIPLSQYTPAGPSNGGNSQPTVINNHFHGNLEFPNVKDGHDAEEFIRQLESMATTS